MTIYPRPPNGWRLSGERKRVRCSRALGGTQIDTKLLRKIIQQLAFARDPDPGNTFTTEPGRFVQCNSLPCPPYAKKMMAHGRPRHRQASAGQLGLKSIEMHP